MRISKLLTLILALLMVLSVFAGCNQTSNPGETDTESSGGSNTESETAKTEDSETETETEEETVEGGSVIDGLSYPGTVLEVLCWVPSNLPEYVEETDENTTVIDQAVFNRCDYAENRLSLRTRWNVLGAAGVVNDTAERENNNGGKYAIIVNESNFVYSLAIKGVYSNLIKYKDTTIDFEHPAWPKTLLDDITVADKLFFTTGDISTNLIFMTGLVYFNKNLVKDLGINEKIQTKWGCSDLYQLVTEGKWTLDKMITLSENVYKDQNNDGKKNFGDRFGLNTYGVLVDNFYYGGGYTTVVTTDDGFTISEDFLDATLVGNILTTVTNFLYDTKDGYLEADYSKARSSFASGNVLFSLAPASHAYGEHSLTPDLEYSVLPVPKHSESQASYACTQVFPYSMYGIGSQSKDREAASAFLQALAEESYKVTRPAFIDKMMKGRYSEDPEDALMWDYAINANVFDIGVIYCEAFGEDRDQQLTATLFRDRIANDNNNWTNVLQSYSIPLMLYANGLADVIRGIPD